MAVRFSGLSPCMFDRAASTTADWVWGSIVVVIFSPRVLSICSSIPAAASSPST